MDKKTSVRDMAAGLNRLGGMLFVFLFIYLWFFILICFDLFMIYFYLDIKTTKPIISPRNSFVSNNNNNIADRFSSSSLGEIQKTTTPTISNKPVVKRIAGLAKFEVWIFLFFIIFLFYFFN